MSHTSAPSMLFVDSKKLVVDWFQVMFLQSAYFAQRLCRFLFSASAQHVGLISFSSAMYLLKIPSVGALDIS